MVMRYLSCVMVRLYDVYVTHGGLCRLKYPRSLSWHIISLMYWEPLPDQTSRLACESLLVAVYRFLIAADPIHPTPDEYLRHFCSTRNADDRSPKNMPLDVL